jgi:hypothetical protein
VKRSHLIVEQFAYGLPLAQWTTSRTNEKLDANKKMKDDKKLSYQQRAVLLRADNRFGVSKSFD